MSPHLAFVGELWGVVCERLINRAEIHGSQYMQRLYTWIIKNVQSYSENQSTNLPSFNISRPRDTCIHKWVGSSPMQVMASFYTIKHFELICYLDYEKCLQNWKDINWPSFFHTHYKTLQWLWKTIYIQIDLMHNKFIFTNKGKQAPLQPGSIIISL